MIDGFIKHPSYQLFLKIFIGLITTANMQMVNAQLTPDNSLNSTVRGDTVNNRDIIEGGAIRGSNLFHSFTDFNVGADRGVYFSNPDSIGNILTRVTGSNPSSILGTLGVLGNANLFLINPHGISFGANARLDVKGSFVAASADSIIFDNYEFSSTDTTIDPLLTVNIPRGLRFRDHPGNITLTNSSLSVPEGKTLALIGGDVSLNNTQIISPGSTVELGGLTQAGRVDIDEKRLTLPQPLDSAATNITTKNVSLSNGAVVDVAGGGGGSITINSQNLEITGNSQLRAGIAAGMGSPNAQGGNIQINNTDKITLDNSFIFNGVFGQGNAGNIHINTSSLTLQDGGFINASISGKGNTGAIAITAADGVTIRGESSLGIISLVVSLVAPTGEGNSGGITIDTSTLTLENGGGINASTIGKGNAGAITITAADGVIIRAESSQGVISSVISAVGQTAQGNSGNITIDTSTLTVENGGTINASTIGQGNAGAIVITAADGVTIRGESSRGFSTSVSSAVAPTAQGNSAGITIDTSTLTVENGGNINASTFSKGNGGAIVIRAADGVTIRGESSRGFLSLVVSAVGQETAKGNGGDITIDTSTLTVENGTSINATTFGQGNAGAIVIRAADGVTIRGKSSAGFTSSVSSTVAPTAKGNSGDITIDTSTLTVENAGTINTSTSGQGNAGAINIRATEQVAISGTYFDRILNRDFGGILAVTLTDNNAGNITINTPRFQISDGAGVEAFTQGAGNAGNVTITAPQIV
ncbi:filamentous hemagglutinin N-terminal domain-containing protein, partial [Anabaenopsis tanganyikae CS-531]